MATEARSNRRRVRLIGWEVRPVAMVDDGEDLMPLNINPQMLAAKEWQAFKDGGDERSLDLIRKQIEAAET